MALLLSRGAGSALAVSMMASCIGVLDCPSAAAQDFSEFPVPNLLAFGGSDVGAPIHGIGAGPDGNLWFTEYGASALARITTGGSVTEYSGFPNAGCMAPGSDGALWYTETDFAGRITGGTPVYGAATTAPANMICIGAGPDGDMWFTALTTLISSTDTIEKTPPPGDTWTPYSLPNGFSPAGIATGPDGDLWITNLLGGNVGRMTTGGALTIVPLANGVSTAPSAIVAGPDNNMWVTGNGEPYQVARITLNQAVTGFTANVAQSNPWDIIVGPDGNLWYTDSVDDSINRVTPAGVITRFQVPTANAQPTGITVGPDLALWFVEAGAAQIGRMNVPGSDTSLAAAVLPSSRSVSVGDTATVFATMINAGTAAAADCAIDLLGGVPVEFSYQATDPSTNAPVGTPNTPVTIAAGGSQTFVLALEPSAPLAPTVLNFGFDCANTTAAATFPGLDTVLLSASTTPTPDIVALAATADNDGIVHVLNGAGAFAVATVDLGAGAAITATADTGSATLPVSIALCQTDPSTGACLATAAASVTTTVDADATPTFAVFVAANGSIPFQPGANRVFVTFSDASGIVRGSTSVAVETE